MSSSTQSEVLSSPLRTTSIPLVESMEEEFNSILLKGGGELHSDFFLGRLP